MINEPNINLIVALAEQLKAITTMVSQRDNYYAHDELEAATKLIEALSIEAIPVPDFIKRTNFKHAVEIENLFVSRLAILLNELENLKNAILHYQKLAETKPSIRDKKSRQVLSVEDKPKATRGRKPKAKITPEAAPIATEAAPKTRGRKPKAALLEIALPTTKKQRLAAVAEKPVEAPAKKRGRPRKIVVDTTPIVVPAKTRGRKPAAGKLIETTAVTKPVKSIKSDKAIKETVVKTGKRGRPRKVVPEITPVVAPAKTRGRKPAAAKFVAKPIIEKPVKAAKTTKFIKPEKTVKEISGKTTKRGRPRKVVAQQVTVTEPAKVMRGRKPATMKPDKPVKAATVAKTTTAKAAKRGRPRKAEAQPAPQIAPTKKTAARKAAVAPVTQTPVKTKTPVLTSKKSTARATTKVEKTPAKTARVKSAPAKTAPVKTVAVKTATVKAPAAKTTPAKSVKPARKTAKVEPQKGKVASAPVAKPVVKAKPTAKKPVDLITSSDKTKTVKSKYAHWVLDVLATLGGSAKSADVYKQIEVKYAAEFVPEMLTVSPGSTLPKWKENVKKNVQYLRQFGFLKPDSPKGIWELKKK